MEGEIENNREQAHALMLKIGSEIGLEISQKDAPPRPHEFYGRGEVGLRLQRIFADRLQIDERLPIFLS